MKTLMLMRHAKSGYPEGVADFERPLNGRGRGAAQRIGAYLAEERMVPDFVLCSAATRARQSFDYLCQGMTTTPKAAIEPKLYLASARVMLDHLHAAPDTSKTVLLVGHNPGLQVLALDLAGRGGGKDHQRLIAKFPTAGLAVFQCEIEEWSDLAAPRCTLLRFVTPRQLVEAD